jgi:hypothetical protein
VLLAFNDPSPCQAVCGSTVVAAVPPALVAARYDLLEVLAVPREAQADGRGRQDLRSWLEAVPDEDLRSSLEAVPPDDDLHSSPEAMPPAERGAILSAKVDDTLVLWRPGRAVLQAPPQRIEALLPALAEFAFYEGQLRRLEDEIAAAWPGADQDLSVAHDAAALTQWQRKELGRRMTDVFRRRIRHVRIEPHLYEPAATLDPRARQLGDALRAAAAVEDRLETLDGKIEVFEYIYEMAGQRSADYTHFKRGIMLELLIVVLLAIEVILSAVDCWLQYHLAE